MVWLPLGEQKRPGIFDLKIEFAFTQRTSCPELRHHYIDVTKYSVGDAPFGAAFRYVLLQGVLTLGHGIENAAPFFV